MMLHWRWFVAMSSAWILSVGHHPKAVAEGVLGAKVFRSPTLDNVPHDQLQRSESSATRLRRNVISNALLPRRIGAAEEDDTSLRNLLLRIFEGELKECGVLVAYDDSFKDSSALQGMMLLPVKHQIVRVSSVEDLELVLWAESKCQAYLFLLGDHFPLIDFSQSLQEAWDYMGRFLVVGMSQQDHQEFCSSRKGRKTQHILTIRQTGSGGQWSIFSNQLYRDQNIVRLNTWKDNTFTSSRPLFPDKLHDLHGAILKVVTFEWEPSTFKELGTDGEVEDRYGVDIEVVRAVAHVLNFTINFVEPPAGELWGDQKPNGSWTGMMGLLERGEAEIAAANLYVSSRRLSVLEYTAPYDSELSCFMARKEPPLPRWQALAFPFQLWTWLAVLVTLLITGPMLFLMARYARYGKGEAPDMVSVAFGCVYVFGVHCCRSQNILPRTTSTRVFVVSLWLYAVILTIAYSTNLTAFLIVSASPGGIETISDLYQSGKEVAGTGYFYKDALASSGDPYLQGLTERYRGYSTTDDILRKVVSGRAVYLQNRGSLEYVAATKFGNLALPGVRIMKECFAPYSIALAVQKHSPLKKNVDVVIGRLQNSGLIRQYFLQSLRRATASQELEEPDRSSTGSLDGRESAEGVTPLTLDHLQGVFLLMAFGWCLSGISFIAESLL